MFFPVGNFLYIAGLSLTIKVLTHFAHFSLSTGNLLLLSRFCK